MSAVRRWTFDSLLDDHVRSRPGRLAVVDGERRLTFAGLHDRVERLAGALTDAGVGRGDRILWLGQNSFRVLELLLAAARTGSMLCPANWRQSADEMRFVLDDLEPAIVVWQESEIGERVAEARAASDSKAVWLRHDRDGDDSYESFLSRGGPRAAAADVQAEDALLALYTAAFEGRPNAALLSHTALLVQDLVIARVQALTDESVFLNSGPLFHIATLMTTTAAFHHGAANVFTPRVEPEDVCRLIERERCTHAFLMRPTIEHIRDAGLDRRYDLSSLWEAPDPDRYRGGMIGPAGSVWAERPGGYGQTEAVGLATFAGLGAPAAGRAGRPSPATQVRIVDEAGHDVASGDVGEILLRGPTVMLGYWNRDDLNASRADGGWHHTSDLGRREVDGSITFVGPKARLIKSAAENIYPAEVEAALSAHPAVGEVCVIGVPDATWTQTVRAVVVLRDGATADEAELIEHCRDRIASYKKPRSVVFTGALPRAATGLVDRDAVDAAFGGGGYPGSPS
jgi:acyl-CoA synthetase (AMP-forming)/AMP-acid ligase II